jgi:trans-2,3-dihydro-3-hydroxyanthranilate isomerase
VIVRFVLWSLADSHITIAELREYIRNEAAPAFSDVPGVLFKAWIADENTERWGAIYVFANADAADQPLPSRARELIGKEPDIVEIFDLEATVSVSDQLDRLGLAFE